MESWKALAVGEALTGLGIPFSLRDSFLAFAHLYIGSHQDWDRHRRYIAIAVLTRALSKLTSCGRPVEEALAVIDLP